MPEPTLTCHYCGRTTPPSVVCCDDDAFDKAAAEEMGRALRVDYTTPEFEKPEEA